MRHSFLLPPFSSLPERPLYLAYTSALLFFCVYFMVLQSQVVEIYSFRSCGDIKGAELHMNKKETI